MFKTFISCFNCKINVTLGLVYNTDIILTLSINLRGHEAKRGKKTFNILKCVIPLIVLIHLKGDINQNLITIPLTFDLKPSISLHSGLLCDS